MTKTSLDTYSENHSKPEDTELRYIVEETKTYTKLPQMCSEHIQGKLIMMLVQLVNPKKILEIGTFTGYGTLALAKASGNNTVIHTCDVNKNTAKIAKKHFNNSAHGHKIIQHIGPALTSIKNINEIFEFIFIDADKLNYPNYFKELLPKLSIGGIMVLDNMLWRGDVLTPEKPSAKGVHKTNQLLRDEPSVDNVLVNFRDGVQIVRKIF
ncbi:MAG: O-methyltransferase [Francisellaceae bacterium]|jgi:caffeoyl-CoA O-methyltransferase|nr:O-methyltransferase [Francisellaceae bacterium]MBT6207196.1 O-methyltransferase [Francisellaceae bacterium]MBT6539825.1 O-methyltransferase [Francisellaceae bacterium]